MKHFLFVQSFEDLLVVGLLPGQEVSLRGNRVLPLLRVLLVLLVRFLRLLLLSLQLLLLSVYCLYFLLDLPDLGPIDPDLLSLLIWNVLSQTDFVVAHPLTHLVSLHLVALYHVLQHLALAATQQFLLHLEFFPQQTILLPK